jgi:hypothetical protein
VRRQRLDQAAEHGDDVLGAVIVAQVSQQHIAGVALHQGRDRGAAGRTHDQVPFPGAGQRAILHLRGTLRDHQHLRDPPPPRRTPLGLALGPPGPQLRGQLPAQLPARLHKQRQIDRLVTDTHLRIIGIVTPESGRDLLRRPTLTQPRLHRRQQPRTRRQLGQLGTSGHLPSAPLGPERAIALPAPAPRDLATHRRRRPPQRPRDRTP